MQDIFIVFDLLMEFKLLFIDVIYYCEEFIYKKCKSGYYEKMVICKCLGIVGICVLIMYCYGVDVVLYLICGGFIQEDMENVLIDLYFFNVDNVLVLCGDVCKFEGKFVFEEGGYEYVLDLVK